MAFFTVGQTIAVDTGANVDSVVIARVGMVGATTVSASTAEGATVIPVENPVGRIANQPLPMQATNALTSMRQLTWVFSSHEGHAAHQLSAE